VLIAFAIAVLALGLLFQAASSGGSAARTAGYYEEAVSRAKSRMAALGRATPMIEGETQGDDGGPYRWRVTVSPAAVAAPPANAPPIKNRVTLYDVEVAISWTAAGRKREVVLHTRRLGTAQGAADG
jgi:general secretion pathway protein I